MRRILEVQHCGVVLHVKQRKIRDKGSLDNWNVNVRPNPIALSSLYMFLCTFKHSHGKIRPKIIAENGVMEIYLEPSRKKLHTCNII